MSRPQMDMSSSSRNKDVPVANHKRKSCFEALFRNLTDGFVSVGLMFSFSFGICLYTGVVSIQNGSFFNLSEVLLPFVIILLTTCVLPVASDRLHRTNDQTKNRQADTIDWERWQIKFSKISTEIAARLEINDFVYDLLAEGLIDGDVCYHIVHNNSRIQKVNVLVDHMVESKNSNLLEVIIVHEDIKSLLGSIGNTFVRTCLLTGEEIKILSSSLIPEEIDKIADHLYENSCIESNGREDIQWNKNKRRKMAALAQYICNKASYDCLKNTLSRMDREDVCVQLRDEVDNEETQQAVLMEANMNKPSDLDQDFSDYRDNFIARSVIRHSYTLLLDGLCTPDVDNIVDHLYQDHVLDSEMRNDIHEEGRRKSKTRCLLDKVAYTGYRGYSQFKTLLQKDHGHLKSSMDVAEKEFRAKPEEKLMEELRHEPADIRVYLEVFDGKDFSRWNFWKKGTRQKVMELAEKCIHPLGLSVHNTEEGSVVISLGCKSVEDLLRFYDSYKSGDLANRFARHVEGGSSNRSSRVSIDKHTLLTAFTILVNKEWPPWSTGTCEDGMVHSLETDSLAVDELRKELKECKRRESALCDELNKLRNRETEICAQSYLMYKANITEDAPSEVTTGSSGIGSLDETSTGNPETAEISDTIRSQQRIYEVVTSEGFKRYIKKLEGAIGPGLLDTIAEGLSGEETVTRLFSTLPVPWENVCDGDMLTLLETKKPVHGMAVVGNAIFISHCGDSNLYLYDMESHTVRTVSVPQLRDPAQFGSLAAMLSANESNCKANLALLSYNPRTLYLLLVSLTERTLSVLDTIMLEYWPRSVVWDMHTRNLLVTESNGAGYGGSIYIYDEADGYSSSSVSVVLDNIDYPVTSIRLSSAYWVAAWLHNTIVSVDGNGQVIKKYPVLSHDMNMDAARPQYDLNHPQTLALLPNGNFIVGDYHAVQEINPSGQNVHTLARAYGEFGIPCMCVHENNVYIAYGVQGDEKKKCKILILDLCRTWDEPKQLC